MSPRILVAASPGERRVAVIDDAAPDGAMLRDFAIGWPGAPDGVGDRHRGRVVGHVPGMAGAFIALAGGAEGFLPDSAGGAGLGAGQAVTVRITRGAQGGKGPRLAGDDAAMAAEGPPALLHPGPDALARLAALWPEAPVFAADTPTLALLHAEHAPRLGAGRAGLQPWPPGLAAEIAALGESATMAPGGVRISLHPTPALVAIDVDTAGATSARGGRPAMLLAANRAALPEIARQIRLRNLSGAILIDFAGLSPAKRGGLRPDLLAAFASDPMAPRLLGFTQLGLAEIVRRRVHAPLHEMLAAPQAAAGAALRQLAERCQARTGPMPVLHAAPALAALLAADTRALAEFALFCGQALPLRADPALPGWRWMIAETPNG